MKNGFNSFEVNKLQKKYDLVIFFVLAYVIAWFSFACELLIQSQGIKFILFNDFNIVLFIFQTITKFGPTLAGLLVAIWLGKPVVKDLLLRQTDLSKPIKYYIFALLFPPLVMIIALLITMGLDSSIALTFAFPGFLIGLIYWLGLRFFFGGGLGEELGFRGLALTRMLVSSGPLKASLYLGLIWSFWHMPGWILSYDSVNGIIVRSIGQIIVNFIIQLAFTVSLSFFFTLLFIKAEGNILIVSILHGSLNGFSAYFEHELFNILENDLWVILYILGFVIVGIVCFSLLKNETEVTKEIDETINI